MQGTKTLRADQTRAWTQVYKLRRRKKFQTKHTSKKKAKGRNTDLAQEAVIGDGGRRRSGIRESEKRYCLRRGRWRYWFWDLRMGLAWFELPARGLYMGLAGSV